MIFLRFFLTALTMIPIILVMKKSFKIDFKTLLLVIITSLVFITYLKYFFLGTKFGTAGLGGALVTTLIPINTFLIMALMFGKKIQRKDIFALILGAIGVLTILNIWSFSYEDIFTTHNMYFLFASMLWPILTIVSSKITHTSPIVFTFYMYVITTILVLVFFIDFPNIPHEKFDDIFWINILCLAVISTTFATTIYFIGIDKLGTNEVSSFIFLVPFFAIGLSAIFLKEEIGLTMIIGTILTIISVTILNDIKIFKKKKINF